jgi:hypothetical protein
MTDILLFPEHDIATAADAVGQGLDISPGVAQEPDGDIGATGLGVDERNEQVTGNWSQVAPDQVPHRAGQVHAKLSIDQGEFMCFLNFFV